MFTACKGYENKALSSGPVPISLNACIAILTALYSASMMHGVSAFIGQSKWLHFKKKQQKLKDFEAFDVASRGPLGSFLLICKIPRSLSTLGAGITICTLVLGALTQQLVKVDQRLVRKPDADVTFGHTHSYDRGSVNELANSDVVISKFAVYRSTSDTHFDPFNINVTDCSLSMAVYDYTNAKSNGSSFNFEESREVDLGRDSPWNYRSVGNNVLTGSFFVNESQANNIPALDISWVDLKGLQNFLESRTIVTEWVDGNWKNNSLGLSAALTGTADLPKLFKAMATKNEAFYSIRWAWIIGPCVLEGLALLFAGLSIYGNSRRTNNVPLWKSSALAVLSCHKETKDRLIRSSKKHMEEIENEAEEIELKLE
ncbi:unnamed protein product [Clonostachys rosea]|uniref:Uncharacterized protein n=1 Tax=Bionectria ochroleuca TaxID=29856 RepID=A0ABY6U9T4_BIOOC|nr:unnamed protein product [Clonostachys rosea]